MKSSLLANMCFYAESQCAWRWMSRDHCAYTTALYLPFDQIEERGAGNELKFVREQNLARWGQVTLPTQACHIAVRLSQPDHRFHGFVLRRTGRTLPRLRGDDEPHVPT